MGPSQRTDRRHGLASGRLLSSRHLPGDQDRRHQRWHLRPDCSLREAIDAANTNPGADDVPVPAGFYLLTLGQLVVSEALATTFSSAEASTAPVYN